jgi:hypothetical protein
MREVTYEDRYGYKHVALVRDEDPDDFAPNGIVRDPPDLDRLDWEQIKKDLHNALVDRGLFTWADVQQRKGLRGAVLSAFKRNLILLYREVDREVKQ